MVHMWVNTVTGCGLPRARKEINGRGFSLFSSFPRGEDPRFEYIVEDSDGV